MERVSSINFVIIAEENNMPFICNLLQNRGFDFSGYRTSYPCSEYSRIEKAGNSWIVLDMRTRHQFAQIPALLLWAKEAKLEVGVTAYVYGEGFGNNQTTYAPAYSPEFWEILARGQYWYEKNEN